MTITLLPLTPYDLAMHAQGNTPDAALHNAGQDGLPPPFVAARALESISAGKSQHWCATFYIVRDAGQEVVGACGFKDEPVGGVVEVGYGVASACRNEGIATKAVAVLLDFAFASDDVHQVLAQINPDNIASAKVVEKLGFVRAGTRVDDDGEILIQWVAARPA